MYDLIIIGGGPAGVAAGVYAARKKMKTALITDSFGGQSIVSSDIHNWIGETNITGLALAEKLEAHVRRYEPDIEIWNDRVEKVARGKNTHNFSLQTRAGKTVETRTILITTGSRRKRLGVPGEDAFDGKGVVFCSTCDAPLFSSKDVAVVGGGNAGLEAVIDLLPYARKIYLMHRRDTLKGDPVTQEKIKASPQVEVIYNALVEEITGDTMVRGITYRDAETGAVSALQVEGVFVEIGSMPNSDCVKDMVNRDAVGRIIIDARTGATSCAGIWAAGDVTDALYQQNTIAVGDAIRATLNIYAYIL